MDELLGEFVAESRELLEALETQIVAWETDPGDKELLDSIFRFFHTVKGNCGFFDLPRLEKLSHFAEDALSDIRSGQRKPDSALVDAVLAIIDRISEMIEALEAGQDFPESDDEPLIAALEEDAEPDAGEIKAAVTGGGPRIRKGGPQRSIRLPVELLDRVMSGVSDMVVARNDLARRLHAMNGETGLEAPFNRLSTILTEVRDAMTRTRMQRIEQLFSTYPRVVRDLSAELGKQVMIELESGDVELDREMIELIRDPMMHMIRNAIDHGLETPAERRAAGKREIGTLSISARQTGNEIRIGIVDDGRGIDADKLVAKAIAAGTLTQEEAENLSPRERNALICEAGMSTRDQASAISGRGVGMDVVRANIERAGGSLSIDSTPGSGTRILLNVPLTLSIVPSLTFSVGDHIFAIPRSYVDEIVGIPEGDARRVQLGGKSFITIRERRIAALPVADVLQTAEAGAQIGSIFLVIRLVGGDTFALAVDEILNHEELVVKPITPEIMATGFYVGTTQLDDGSPVLMLDISGLAREAGMIQEVQHRSYIANLDSREVEEEQAVPMMLFSALDGVRRAVAMSAVIRVEKVLQDKVRLAGINSKVVIEERILPLAGIPEDFELGEKLSLFRISDGSGEVALAFEEMIDLVSLTENATKASDRDGSNALALIGGQPTEIVDCLALFEAFGMEAAEATSPVCRIPSDDPWMRDFLRPLVESAGYRVIDERAGEEADVAIAVASNGKSKPKPNGAQAILLRTAKDTRAKNDRSIYRYDRDGLMAALKAARTGS
jgi:two-component system chemotaxis sensor kinase CheA